MPESITFFGLTVFLDMRLAVLLIIVFIAGIIRGFTGFGSALLTVPALAVLFGPAQAVVIAVIIEMPVSLGLLPVALRGADRRTVLPMFSMFIVFVPVGAMLLKLVDPEFMRIIISILVLIMVAVMALQDRVMVFLSKGGILSAGAISGLSQGMTGMAGPLFVTALLARGESAFQTRANTIALAGAITTLSLISFWFIGLLTLKTGIYATIATPAILLGVWIGSELFRNLSHWNLRGVILVFLTITASVTLYAALQ